MNRLKDQPQDKNNHTIGKHILGYLALASPTISTLFVTIHSIYPGNLGTFITTQATTFMDASSILAIALAAIMAATKNQLLTFLAGVQIALVYMTKVTTEPTTNEEKCITFFVIAVPLLIIAYTLVPLYLDKKRSNG